MSKIRISTLSLSANHPGITDYLSGAYAEAAGVCLSRHHSSPVDFTCELTSHSSSNEVHWEGPSERTKNAWNNVDDATRDGAYAIALLSLEQELQLVAIARAETRTGADYYLAPVGQNDHGLEQAIRLEISGIDHGTKAQLNQRLKQKVSQAKRGNSNLPALATVVGFKLCTVMVEIVET